VESICPSDRTTYYPSNPEAYFVTQLSPSLGVEWRWQNTNTESCVRNPDNSLTCTSDHPNGFEFCVNAVAVDANGVVYADSEDGNVYAVAQGGTLAHALFMNLSLGAAYTPVSIGADGKVYSQNFGHMLATGLAP
jgi:outer membrane protein assembly factor BamB